MNTSLILKTCALLIFVLASTALIVDTGLSGEASLAQRLPQHNGSDAASRPA